jgi:hypothetical protein
MHFNQKDHISARDFRVGIIDSNIDLNNISIVEAAWISVLDSIPKALLILRMKQE